MRIAVLISGEYRKLDVTRHTMPFLDDPLVDVFVSTWDKTIYENKKINLYVEEEVTRERIIRELGRDATICIDRHDLITDKKYNLKMIFKWYSGFNLIKAADVNYDLVIIMRTDLLFNKQAIVNLQDLEKYSNNVAFAWCNSMHLGKLADLCFISSFENMNTIITNTLYREWKSAAEMDWHIWWFDYIKGKIPDICDFPEMSYFIFCRFWTEKNNTFEEAVAIDTDWRDIRFLNQRDMWGESFTGGWSEEIRNAAAQKWETGHFDKYK